MNSDFTEQEIREFEEQWQVPVLRIANVTGKRLADSRTLDGRAGVMVRGPVVTEDQHVTSPNYLKTICSREETRIEKLVNWRVFPS